MSIIRKLQYFFGAVAALGIAYLLYLNPQLFEKKEGGQKKEEKKAADLSPEEEKQREYMTEVWRRRIRSMEDRYMELQKSNAPEAVIQEFKKRLEEARDKAKRAADPATFLETSRGSAESLTGKMRDEAERAKALLKAEREQLIKMVKDSLEKQRGYLDARVAENTASAEEIQALKDAVSRTEEQLRKLTSEK